MPNLSGTPGVLSASLLYCYRDLPQRAILAVSYCDAICQPRSIFDAFRTLPDGADSSLSASSMANGNGCMLGD